MNNNYYQVYLNGVKALAQTLVVKSELSAVGLNQYVSDYFNYPVDTLAPQTWKYYLNLAGDYHPTDTPMDIISSDNLDPIVFNKTNLTIHRTTARDYQYGTRQYRELVDRYPNQEKLILGILYPVDITRAIDAPDHTILGYPPQLVESNEYTLIEQLQTWTDGFFARWINQQYSISDDLYTAYVLGIYYLNLIPAIVSARLNACKTSEAHSFHVSQYLSSHSEVGKYFRYLTRSQAMYFYRNIAYIERHAGMEETLTDLVEHIMTVRQLPVAEYVMRHDQTNQIEDVLPEIVFRRYAMNRIPTTGVPETTDLPGMLAKERDLAFGNAQFEEDKQDTILDTLENSLSGVLPTKVLESSTVDYSNAEYYPLDNILLNHWLHWVDKGLYTAYTSVINPRTSDRIPLSAKDAFVLGVYVLAKSLNIDLITVPPMFAQRVQRDKVVTKAELMGFVDKRYCDEATIDEALRYVRNVEPMISTDAFYSTCYRIKEASKHQRNLIAYQEHMTRRSMTMGMVTRIYCDRVIHLEPEGTPYSTWLTERNIYLDGLSRGQYDELYAGLVSKATGMDVNTTESLRSVQAAMVSMISQLSSYSIQFVKKISDENISVIGLPMIRIGDRWQRVHAYRIVHLPDVNVLRADTSVKNFTKLDLSQLGWSQNHATRVSNRYWYDLNIGPRRPITGRHVNRTIPLKGFRIKSVKPEPENNEGILPVLGLKYYLALTQEQRDTLK